MVGEARQERRDSALIFEDDVVFADDFTARFAEPIAEVRSPVEAHRERAPSLAFLCCVEPGPLESQTLLLCRSIRRFGGRFRDAPIYAFQPRRGPGLAPGTLEALAQLGVRVSTEVLNTEFHRYPVGNKVFVCARAEESLGEDLLVFLDSDTVVVAEPADLDLPPGLDSAVRPADSSHVVSTGPEHPKDAYWRRLYALRGLAEADIPYVTTEYGRRVRAYFSSGLIAARRAAGLFRRWRANFLSLVRGGHQPEDSGIERMDEISLVVTLLADPRRIRLLGPPYNYLIFKRWELLPPWHEAQLRDLVHIHYCRSFHQPGFLASLEPPLEAGEVRCWLEKQLPLPSVVARGA